MGRHSTKITSPISTLDESVETKKRKHEDDTAPLDLAIDVSALEPPSKKALRRARKVNLSSNKSADTLLGNGTVTDGADASQGRYAEVKPSSFDDRTFEIWVGNLPWTTTIADLRTFFTERLGVEPNAITRLHLPAPKKGSSHTTHQTMKPRNRGFAYVDFSSQEVLDAALALSEELLSGRRILIKDSKNFEGRPEPPKEGESNAKNASGNPPNQRIFVGNLGFDTTKEDLTEHFSQCGTIADLHVATFEDSGKCKGYAWVEFEDIESGKAAARGWVEREIDPAEDTEEKDLSSESKQKIRKKARKWWVNRLQGRELRIEFAEDKTLRYKKRFGKNAGEQANGDHTGSDTKLQDDTESKTNPNKFTRSERQPSTRRPLQKIDPRNIAPGAALAAAPRSTAAIVKSRGKKVVFD